MPRIGTLSSSRPVSPGSSAIDRTLAGSASIKTDTYILSLSLSLYIYIYLYTYTYIRYIVYSVYTNIYIYIYIYICMVPPSYVPFLGEVQEVFRVWS